MLGSASGMEVATSSQDVAGQLAQWLNAFDAMALHAAHQTIEAGPAGAAARVLPDAAQAQAAIEGLNGQSVSGRALVVNLARPRDDSGPRGGGGGGYRSGNGGGYRGGGGRY